MLKKVLIVAILMLVMMSGSALANDGGAEIGDKRYLDIRVETKTNKTEIGSPFDLTLTLTNNTLYPIKDIDLYGVFGEYEWPDHPIESIEEIKPGEQVELEVTAKVGHKVDWYIKDGKFFTDIEVDLRYLAVLYDDIYEEDEDDAYWDFYNAPIKKIPIELINLFIGDEFLKLDVIELEDMFYFYEYCDNVSRTYEGEYPARIDNEVSIRSKISNIEIEDIFLHFYGSDSIELGSTNPCNCEYETKYFINSKKIPQILPAEYKVTFKVGNKYYAVQEVKEYPTVVINMPELKVDIKLDKDSNGNTHCIAIVKNVSEQDYNNFFIKFNRSYYEYYPTGKDLYQLKAGETIEVPAIYNSKNYIFGYVIGNYIYGWEYYQRERTENDWEDGYVEYYRRKSAVSPSPTSKPTPTPKLTPWKIVIPPSKGMPKPDRTPEPSLTKEVVVTNVERVSSIHLWVWIALIAVVVGAIVLILVLRRNGARELKD